MTTKEKENNHNSNDNTNSLYMTEEELDTIKSLILSFDCEEMAQALKRIHDIALYCSDVPIEKSEKAALYQVNMLSEGMARLQL